MARSQEMLDIDVGDGRLAVARWPGDGPTLVLVHGITGSHLAWARIANDPALAGYELLAPDLRGRCGSRDLPGPYGLDRHVDDLVALMEARGLLPVCLAGHSLGAYIAVQFGVAHPQRVTGLGLVDGGIAKPVPVGVEPGVLLEKVLGPALARLSRTFPSREAYRDFWRAHPAFSAAEGAWNSDVEAYFDYDLGGEAPHLLSRVREEAVRADGLGPMSGAMVTMIDRVTRPMLLLTAVRGLLNQPEPLMPVAEVAAKAAALPQLVWHEIADTNHYSITLGRGAAMVAAHLAAFACRHAG